MKFIVTIGTGVKKSRIITSDSSKAAKIQKRNKGATVRVLTPSQEEHADIMAGQFRNRA